MTYEEKLEEMLKNERISKEEIETKTNTVISNLNEIKTYVTDYKASQLLGITHQNFYNLKKNPHLWRKKTLSSLLLKTELLLSKLRK